MKDISKLTDEELFFEWKDWFTIYRGQGALPKDERQYFKDLSKAMRDRKLIADRFSGWLDEKF
jgi:hypothetical protein